MNGRCHSDPFSLLILKFGHAALMRAAGPRGGSPVVVGTKLHCSPLRQETAPEPSSRFQRVNDTQK
jgi:hypothetical protein